MNLFSSIYNSVSGAVVNTAVAIRESVNPTAEGTLSKFSSDLIGVILSSMDQKSLESATLVNKEWKKLGLNKNLYLKFIQEKPETFKSFKFGLKQDFELVKAYNKKSSEDMFKSYAQASFVIIPKTS
jgi:hypothetical protein